MTRKFTTALVVLALALAGSAGAQDRIGYANLELIMSLMPEAKDLSSQLESYQQELGKQIETKQAYAQQKLVEYQEAAASGIVSQAKLGEQEQELQRLDLEIRQSAAEAEQRLMRKNVELLKPIGDRLQATIKDVAVADGYTHVLNYADGTGTSIVLYGDESHDLTRRILTALGIEVPENMEESASASTESESASDPQ